MAAKATTVTINWRGAHVQRAFNGDIQRLVKIMTIETHNEVKRSLNRQGPTKTNPRRKPSRPGTPPKKRTGRLISSIGFEFGKHVGYVGTNVFYGRFLELGTRKMAKRPYLIRALKKTKRRFRFQVQRVRRTP